MDDEIHRVEEVSKIIIKEFNLPQTNSTMILESHSLNELKAYLTGKLSEMMNNNFNQLVNTLYRIDIGEEKVRKIFLGDNRENIPSALADLIIERQLQKLSYRRAHNKGEF